MIEILYTSYHVLANWHTTWTTSALTLFKSAHRYVNSPWCNQWNIHWSHHNQWIIFTTIVTTSRYENHKGIFKQVGTDIKKDIKLGLAWKRWSALSSSISLLITDLFIDKDDMFINDMWDKRASLFAHWACCTYLWMIKVYIQITGSD